MHDPTVDARRVAALLDGRLDGAERQQLLAELGASDEALGAYADAAAVLAELEREGVVAAVSPDIVDIGDQAAAEAAAAGSPATVPARAAPVASIADVRARRRNEPRWRVPPWMALAAGIAVVMAAPALWWRARPAGEDGVVAGATSYAALLAPDARGGGLPAGWNGTPWRTTRGAGDPLTPEARAVRIGARLTDLELAAAARDSATVRVIAAEVAALLDEVQVGGAAAVTYRALATSLVDRAALAGARRDAALVAGEEAVALGMWLEAARVAAARRDAAFFRTRESRAALARARGSAVAVDAAVFDQIATPTERPPLTWEQLGDALTRLLRAHGG